MTSKRTIAIGDIHGCHDKLTQLLNQLDWDPRSDDELIFLGDYIDRGPKSFEVIETIIELQQSSQNVITLCGNHEQMFLSFLNGNEDISIEANGLPLTIKSYYEQKENFPVSHIDFYNNLKIYHETDEYIFVHAGLKAGVSLDEQNVEDLLWIREDFLNTDFDFGKTVVFGHTPFKEVYIAHDRIGLDTGAVYGGKLTAMDLSSKILISI